MYRVFLQLSGFQGNVFTVDSRDTIFQAMPFQFYPELDQVGEAGVSHSSRRRRTSPAGARGGGGRPECVWVLTMMIACGADDGRARSTCSPSR